MSNSLSRSFSTPFWCDKSRQVTTSPTVSVTFEKEFGSLNAVFFLYKIVVATLYKFSWLRGLYNYTLRLSVSSLSNAKLSLLISWSSCDCCICKESRLNLQKSSNFFAMAISPSSMMNIRAWERSCRIDFEESFIYLGLDRSKPSTLSR